MPRKKTRRSRASKKSRNSEKTRATSSMSLTELQVRAKKMGVPFGGLNKAQLVRKINAYY